MIRDCKKLLNRNQRFMFAHIASSNEASDQSIQFSADELANFHLYQESLKSPSTQVTTIIESGNPNTCLVSSSSSEWVIDSGATYHMTSNSNLFSTFQLSVTTFIFHDHLVDGSQSCVLGSGTIFPTPSIPIICLEFILIFLLIWYL